MTKIAMRFVTTTDIPIGDALVAIRLTRSDYEDKTSGVIMPRLEEFHTDADGFLQVDLLPATHLYHVTAYDTVQDIALHHDFIVPEVEDSNTVLLLPDLIVPPDTVLSSFPYDEEALAIIIQAKVEAVAAAVRAEASADLAQGAIDSTAANAAISEAAKIVVQAAEIAVEADAAEVRANTVLVTNYTATALQHKNDAAASAVSANAAKQVALDQSAIATQAAAAAQISETNSGASNTAAQAASVASAAARDQAVTARNTTVAAKDETIAAKNVTVQKAAELASQLAAFNEIYIGKFAVHPIVDGNGNPLKVGAIYENTTVGKLYQYETDLQWHPYDEDSQQQMNNATLSANSAAASAGSATASKNAAETSKIAAQTAKTAAEAAQVAAAASATTATTAKDSAVAASNTAVAARDTATQKAVDAAASAAAAALSASQAASAQLPADWTQTDNTKKDFIKNKPVLAAVATTGAKADVGLGNVDNTSDANKPVSTAQQTALNAKAPLASPALTGIPTVPTQAAFDNTTQAVNAAWVNQRGLAYKPVNGISLISGNNTFLESHIGAWLQFSYAGGTLVVGIADAKYTGSSFTVRASNPGIVTFPGNSVGTPNNTAGAASYSMVKGQVTTFTSLGTTGWWVTADSLMPAEITKTHVGLGNVDNTSDANKPVSSAQATALASKAPLDSPAFTGSVTGVTKAAVGLSNVDNTSDSNKPVSTAQQTALDSKAPTNNPTFTGLLRAPVSGVVMGNDSTGFYSPILNTLRFTTNGVDRMIMDALGNTTFYGTVVGVSKAMVGLGNVDNTADSSKPVSTAQQTALNTKAALNGDLAQNFNVASLNGSYVGGMMNRVINGDMRIDQRNNGASVVTGFAVDRFMLLFNIAGKLSAGRNLNGQSSPSGFTHNLGVTTTTAYVPTTPDTFGIRQGIEGNNVADLAWGTAGAKAVTLSFNVLSSVTGTHSGAVSNGAATRSYPYTFSIPVANVWTAVSVNIPGDTAGVWATDAGLGVELRWNLGSGTSYSAAAGAWSNSNAVGATGAVSVVSTLGAKFHITGIQFEAGSKTPFSFRSYTEEIALCHRYCAVDAYAANMVVATGQAHTTSDAYGLIPLNSAMRVVPTATITGTLARLGGEVVSAPADVAVSPSGVFFRVVWSATPFVAGNAVVLAASTNVTVTRSAEL